MLYQMPILAIHSQNPFQHLIEPNRHPYHSHLRQWSQLRRLMLVVDSTSTAYPAVGGLVMGTHSNRFKGEHAHTLVAMTVWRKRHHIRKRLSNGLKSCNIHCLTGSFGSIFATECQEPGIDALSRPKKFHCRPELVA